MITRFEMATAVEPLGDGRYNALCDVAWSAPRGPNGGYLAAITAISTSIFGSANLASTVALAALGITGLAWSVCRRRVASS